MDPLRQIALCLIDRPLLASGYRPSRTPHVVACAPRGEPAPLRLVDGQSGLALGVSLRYEIAGPSSEASQRWAGRPFAYRFDVLDRERREVIAYHWHLHGIGPSFPHLHVTGRLGNISIGTGLPNLDIGSAHLPTRQAGMAEVARLLIEEFGVAPRLGDWRRVIDGAL